MVEASLQQHSIATVNCFPLVRYFVCAVLEENLGNWITVGPFTFYGR